MAIISCALSLFGCTKNPKKPDNELTSISISQNHMDRTYCYSFGAYKKNDTYTLNARCMIEKGDNDYEDVELENISITKEEFKQFEELDKKYDFFSLRKPNKIEKNIFFVVDETITNFSVSYGDYTQAAIATMRFTTALSLLPKNTTKQLTKRRNYYGTF